MMIDVISPLTQTMQLLYLKGKMQRIDVHVTYVTESDNTRI